MTFPAMLTIVMYTGQHNRKEHRPRAHRRWHDALDMEQPEVHAHQPTGGNRRDGVNDTNNAEQSSREHGGGNSLAAFAAFLKRTLPCGAAESGGPATTVATGAGAGAGAGGAADSQGSAPQPNPIAQGTDAAALAQPVSWGRLRQRSFERDRVLVVVDEPCSAAGGNHSGDSVAASLRAFVASDLEAGAPAATSGLYHTAVQRFPHSPALVLTSQEWLAHPVHCDTLPCVVVVVATHLPDSLATGRHQLAARLSLLREAAPGLVGDDIAERAGAHVGAALALPSLPLPPVVALGLTSGANVRTSGGAMKTFQKLLVDAGFGTRVRQRVVPWEAGSTPGAAGIAAFKDVVHMAREYGTPRGCGMHRGGSVSAHTHFRRRVVCCCRFTTELLEFPVNRLLPLAHKRSMWAMAQAWRVVTELARSTLTTARLSDPVRAAAWLRSLVNKSSLE